jgi:DNA-binding CsgD family transcriptional regulator
LPRSRAETSKRALARIQRLCCLGIGSEMLMPDLMSEVTALIPSSHASFYWLGPNFEITNVYGNWAPSLGELYFKEFHHTPREDDVIPRINDVAVWPVSIPVLRFQQHLLVDQQTYLRSDFYNLLLRLGGCCDALLVRAREAHRTLGSLYVWRAAGEAPFEPGEVNILESIASFIAHGMTRVTLSEDVFTDSKDSALFVADLNGSVQHAGTQAQHLLTMALVPRWSPTSGWAILRKPMCDIVQLCRMLVATADGEIGQSPPVLWLRNSWGEFVLRAYWFGPTDGGEQTRQIGITIERRVPRVLALRRRVEGLPLTGREKQLCLLLRHDRSRQDLADAMGVSTGTIITHQSSIYAKLGVHSRTELLAALLPK